MSNFYDYVCERFPLVTPAEAARELQIAQMEQDNVEYQNHICSLQRKISAQEEQIDKQKDALRTIRELIMWEFLKYDEARASKYRLEIKNEESIFDLIKQALE